MTTYTCPMHSKVRQAMPGACTVCGMALEPYGSDPKVPASPELADFTRRFWIGLVLTLPVFGLEMGGHVTGRPLISGRLSDWLQIALSTPVVLGCGWPFFVRAARSVRTGHLNMFTLVAMSTGVAWLDSLFAVLTPQIFPPELRLSDGRLPTYFEAAAVITVLVLLGQMLELQARAHTSDAIRALLGLAPSQARRIGPGGTEADIALDKVQPGDHLRVRPGEKVPVDGVILEGRVAIDESLVTGESMPVTKAQGDLVIAGALNMTGSFVMQAQKVGADTLLARIVAMVAQAQRSRAPIQGLADEVSAIFVPMVLAFSALAALVWGLVGPEPRLAYALVTGVSVLIIACPCALGLATPLSIMVGVGRGAGSGILVRSAEALERLERVDTLVLDKTGTLTEGHPTLTEIIALDGQSQSELLRLSASLETASEHPVARAIVAAAKAQGLALSPVNAFDSPLGLGVTGKVAGETIMLGNALYFERQGIDITDLKIAAQGASHIGATALFVARNYRLAGLICISDAIKTTTPEALMILKAQGLRLIMITGDNEKTAKAVAKALGIKEVLAEVLPDQKAAVINRLRREGRRVAMAGDGVNDAPALAAADVGIAMGPGSDVAIESASITLLHGDLLGIAKARHLSRAVMANIRQNLVLAFVYNGASIPIAAGVLFPGFGLMLSPALGAGAMALSSLCVIGNALRLRALRL
jgi:Cu+-exporting ATPase